MSDDAHAGAPPSGPRGRHASFVGRVSLLAATGAGVVSALLYHRPWGAGHWAGTHASRVGLHLAFRDVLAVVHLGGLGVAFAACLVWLARNRLALKTMVPLAAGAVLCTVLALASGLAAPWFTFLPWSDPGLDEAPALISQEQGPFAELVGVAWAYENPAAIMGRTAIALVHGVLPLLFFAAWALHHRRVQRARARARARQHTSV